MKLITTEIVFKGVNPAFSMKPHQEQESLQRTMPVLGHAKAHRHSSLDKTRSMYLLLQSNLAPLQTDLSRFWSRKKNENFGFLMI